MKMKHFLILFMFVFAALAACVKSDANSSISDNLQPVDGDSLESSFRRIRLEGIDAPEYKQKCYTAAGKKYKCGIESLNYIKKIIQGQDIRCECEAEPDRYKRELCICYAGDIEINREMVAAGHAVGYRSNRYEAEENIAKAHKLGIWQGKFMRPELYRTLKREQEAKWCKANPQECKAKKERIKAYKKSLKHK